MNESSILYFVTSNNKKFLSLREKLLPLGIKLDMLEYDFDEGRELSIENVARIKLEQAKNAFPGKKLVIDDRGFFVPALKGFPGPFVKILLDSFSYGGMLKLMSDITDRRAIFSYAVGYFDGVKDEIIVADEVGFICDSARGDNLHGWTELLYIYGHPSFPGRSLAELSDNEWEKYLEEIKDVDPFELLRKHLAAAG